MNNPPVIEVKDLTKAFRTYRKEEGLMGAVRGLFHRTYTETKAADRVSFSVGEGEFVGFLGPNGAGKTTVLKMLSGLLQPTSGSASVLGFNPSKRPVELKRQFALLMGQKNALWWDLPARESLELNRAIYGIDREEFNSTVGELIELLDVRDKMGVMVRELSLGERMKMELIAALLHRPKVLFLDEPTIGLDVMSQKKVREFLREYNRRNKVVTLLTSHYMQDIEELCERVILIDHGRIFFDGSLEEVAGRFTTTKIIEADFSVPLPKGFRPPGVVLEQNPLSIRVEVPRAEVPKACTTLLSGGQVIDLSVQEVPIEEVIRRVFGRQQEEHRLESLS
ncbi:MAG: ATP-binding cassette domain-containing protein [Chthoniobacterales bacterium]|nr:ATP-binding cassette domain-containing protein [Chthoniobacterales bacterium]